MDAGHAAPQFLSVRRSAQQLQIWKWSALLESAPSFQFFAHTHTQTMALVPVRTFSVEAAHPRHPNTAYQKQIRVVSLQDRRPNASSGAYQEWMLQVDLEDVLYPSAVTNGTNGSFYRLLGRSSAGNEHTLTLRRASVSHGLVSTEEFEELKALYHPAVRVFSLVPIIPAVTAALATYGPSPASEELLAGLGLPRPSEWAKQASHPSLSASSPPLGSAQSCRPLSKKRHWRAHTRA